MMTVLTYNRWSPHGVLERTLLAPHLDAGIPRPIAEVLVRRGFATPAAVRDFYQSGQLHDPLLLPDMAAAITRLNRALAQHEHIAVYGDYDADGVTSTAILTLGLRRLGARVTPFVPHRVDDGYDLKPAKIPEIAATGARLLVTVDCGVTAVEAIAAASEAGIDVVVLDHHQPKVELPVCAALVDPHRADSAYPDREICAGMLAFKTMWALWRDRKQADVAPNLTMDDLFEFQEIAAIATVADAMPLTGENRVLLRMALQRLNAAGARNVGVAALLAAARAGANGQAVTARDFSHGIAPRLNAVGRMGAAYRALQLLIATDSRVARGLTDVANLENEKRKEEERRVLQAACAQLEDAEETPVIVVAGEGWNPGVLGPVASRLVERFGRPAIVLALTEEGGKGSGRAPGDYNLHQILAAAQQHTIRWGGHKGACGVEVSRAKLADFTAAVQAAGDAVAPAEPSPAFVVESWVEPTEVSESLLTYLERMEPFGRGNPAPLFGMTGVHVRDAKGLGANTLKGRLLGANGSVTLPFIGFGLAEHYPANWINGREVSAVGYLERDARSQQLHFRVVDLRMTN